MPLMPKRVKYRQSQRGSRKGLAQSGNTLAFGEYGLRAMERCCSVGAMAPAGSAEVLAGAGVELARTRAMTTAMTTAMAPSHRS